MLRLSAASFFSSLSASIGSSLPASSASASASAGSVAARVSSCVSSSLRVGLDGASACEIICTSVGTALAGLACTFRRSCGSRRMACALKRASRELTYLSTSTMAALSSARGRSMEGGGRGRAGRSMTAGERGGHAGYAPCFSVSGGGGGSSFFSSFLPSSFFSSFFSTSMASGMLRG